MTSPTDDEMDRLMAEAQAMPADEQAAAMRAGERVIEAITRDGHGDL